MIAVAQHYGFPTPFLDFTRSLKVAAFFASLAARRQPVNDMVGAIYCFQPTALGWSTTSVEELQNLGFGAFRLLPSAGLRVGRWRLIEPRIPESEDRIGRQRGLFIADYNVRDLQQAGRDAIFFRQHNGEVFEDPSDGITEALLLESRKSRLSRLAEQVKREFDLGALPPAAPLHPLLAGVSLPDTAVIGSSGAELQAILEEAEYFFAEIGRMTKETSELTSALGEVFQTYFQNIRLLGDTGAAPQPGRDGYVNTALRLAAEQLETLGGLSAGHLSELAMSVAPRDDPTDRGPEMPYATGDNRIDEKCRIATAAFLYLAGWQHLVQVYGFRARGMSFLAREVLSGYRIPWARGTPR